MSLLPIPQELNTIAKAISIKKGRCILVGGAVRDFCMGRKVPKDLDVEIFGMDQAHMESVLNKFGKLYTVGKTFGVLKLKTEHAEYDFSIPRYENKIGIGHRGFFTRPDPTMSFEKAASRRDFTINSIGYDLSKQNLYF